MFFADQMADSDWRTVVQKYVFLTTNLDKSVKFHQKYVKKVVKKHISRENNSVLGINLDFFWIRHEISDFLRPSDSYLGQNWRFPFQIPLQRTNPSSPFNLNLKEGQLRWRSISQYRFWSFQGRDTKLERVLAKNQL